MGAIYVNIISFFRTFSTIARLKVHIPIQLPLFYVF